MNATVTFLLADAATGHRLLVMTGIGLALIIILFVLHLISQRVIYQRGFWNGVERGQKEGKQFSLGRPMSVAHLARGRVYEALGYTKIESKETTQYLILLLDADGNVFYVELAGPLREYESGIHRFCVVQCVDEQGNWRYELKPHGVIELNLDLKEGL